MFGNLEEALVTEVEGDDFVVMGKRLYQMGSNVTYSNDRNDGLWLRWRRVWALQPKALDVPENRRIVFLWRGRRRECNWCDLHVDGGLLDLWRETSGKEVHFHHLEDVQLRTDNR